MNYKNKRRLVVGFEIVDGNYQRSHILEIKESDLGKSWDQWDKVDPEEQENIIHLVSLERQVNIKNIIRTHHIEIEMVVDRVIMGLI